MAELPVISISSADLNTWIVAFFFPLARILALVATAPPFNNAALPTRIRLMFGLVIAIAITPVLPDIPPLEPASGLGLWIFAQQLLIGVSMGFSFRLIFTAIDMAGHVIATQMGLGFATLYDPQNTAQTPVLSEFIGLLSLLVFMAIDGHLMLISILTQSFTTLPIGATALDKATWLNLANAGIIIFSSGLLLALPILTALLITNVALGVLSRAAPQLNPFAVGFPITLALGFGMLMILMSYFSTPLQRLFEHGLQSMLGYFVISGR